jgi:hypothetical protein
MTNKLKVHYIRRSLAGGLLYEPISRRGIMLNPFSNHQVVTMNEDFNPERLSSKIYDLDAEDFSLIVSAAKNKRNKEVEDLIEILFFSN